MEEQLISLETAKLAKEKGFNEQCTWMYFRQDKLSQAKMDMYGFPNNYSNALSAPTQSLLQKWLREIYKIDILIERQENSKYRSLYSFLIYNIHYTLVKYDFDNGFSTYEEALEAGLQKALESIKE